MGLAYFRRGRLLPNLASFALYCVCCAILLVFHLSRPKRLGTVKSKRVWIDRCRARAFFLKSKKWTEQLQLPRDSVFVVRNARAISNKLSVAPRDSVFVVFLKNENWTEQLQLPRDSVFVVRNARASSNKLSVARKTCTSVVFGAP